MLCLLSLAVSIPPLHAVQWGPIQIADREIWPGQTLRFPWGGETSFESAYLDSPVFVARGTNHGPTLCITAGIHGDEINGTEIARRVFSWIDPTSLAGTMLKDSPIRRQTDVLVVGIRHGNQRAQFNPPADAAPQAGDTLLVLGKGENLRRLEQLALGHRKHQP